MNPSGRSYADGYQAGRAAAHDILNRVLNPCDELWDLMQDIKAGNMPGPYGKGYHDALQLVFELHCGHTR